MIFTFNKNKNPCTLNIIKNFYLLKLYAKINGFLIKINIELTFLIKQQCIAILKFFIIYSLNRVIK